MRYCVFVALALLFCIPARAESRVVAITVDDLPVVGANDAAIAERVNRALLDAFVRHRVRATGFVVERKIQRLGMERGRRILHEWVRRGQDLGNHTFSHHDLNDLTPKQFFDEVIRGEASFLPLLRERGSAIQKFLRFPFNHAGDTALKRDSVRAFLVERGYTVAVCTIDNSDYEFARAYDKMLDHKDQVSVQRLRTEYLAYTAAEIEYYARLHQQVFGRETSHVMLLHANRLNADVIERLLSLFERKQYRFVTLAEAQSDPAYTTPDGPPTRFGPMWGYRWAHEKGVIVNGRMEPEPPPWIHEYGK